MPQPLIGISISQTQGKLLKQQLYDPDTLADDPMYLYIQAKYIPPLKRAGGIPILLPLQPDDQLLRLLHGIIIPGGDDIPPSYFNHPERYPSTYESSSKIDFDLWLTQKAETYRIPLLGICYGMQLINVYGGGTILQDISLNSELADHGSSKVVEHSITIIPGTRLEKVFGNTHQVYSKHHQGILDCASSLQPTAMAPDGLIEALETTQSDWYLLGVQWHPELQPQDDSIWNDFIAAASRYRDLI